MIKQPPKAIRRLGPERIETNILYEDELGRMVPLLDQTGTPANFERKPTALKRAFAVMKRMDANGI